MKCNICGKDFSGFDLCNNFSLSGSVQYGSKYDGEEFKLHICNKCFDEIIDACKISPFERLKEE